jgi:hypothetical protein
MVEVFVTGIRVRPPGDNSLWRSLFFCCFRERCAGFPAASQYLVAKRSTTRNEKLKYKLDTLMGDGKKTIYRLLPKLPIFSIKSKEEVS